MNEKPKKFLMRMYNRDWEKIEKVKEIISKIQERDVSTAEAIRIALRFFTLYGE